MKENKLPQLTGYLVFLFCLVMIAASRGMGESFAIFLLPLGESFGWNRASLSSVYSVHMICLGIGSLLSGLVFDRFGPRANYFIGLGLLAIAYGFAASLTTVSAFYLVIGICGGFGAALVGIVPAQSLVSRWFVKRRATMLSIVYAGQGIGVMLLAPSIQLVIQATDWQTAYRLAGAGFMILLVLAIIIPWRRFAAGPRTSGKTAEGAESGQQEAVSASPSASVVMVPAAGPGLMEAMRQRPFWGFFTIYAASAIAVFLVTLQVVAYLVEQGFTEVEAAFAFGGMGMLTILGITITGILADLFPRHLVASFSYGLTMIGVISLALLQWQPSYLLLAVFVVAFGLSAGARGPIITTQMADIFAGRGLASIFGATNIGQGCGAALGAFLAGWLYDLTGGYNTGFMISALFLLLGLSQFWLVPVIRYGRSAADKP